MKLKLIAIAKDEAAYIPEWVFHHVAVGFDSISIYTNELLDNTSAVIDKISLHYPVSEINSDHIKASSGSDFQRVVYGIAYQKAVLEGFTHVMFLDIDEFWTVCNFDLNIKEYLSNKTGMAHYSFPWGLKSGEEQFSSPFQEVNTFVMNRHVKTIINTKANIDEVHIHNVVSSNAKSILPDGSTLSEEGKYVFALKHELDTIPDAFILHRISRSQKEYISLLGRGRPGQVDSRLRLKDNRDGYLPRKNSHLKLSIKKSNIDSYTKKYNAFLKRCSLGPEIEKGRKFVMGRYKEVKRLITEDKQVDILLKEKLLKNISLPELTEAINDVNDLSADLFPVELSEKETIKFRKAVGANSRFIDSLRDLSLKYQNQDLDLSVRLMKLANIFRPEGPFIKVSLQRLIAEHRKLKKNRDF
ncbi:glycosyltransferase family 2 protein [Microbulbifer sp. 2304DJ12-6]|uniref:glycosyltransferase family 2 protein n=1 Tax=Microbulbifer sp. 2304DJ12-6 TaxID=3233340 RepID=UPI0039AF27E0